MRTKHILTALALPAVFAACTADEFDSVNINNGDATQARPTVGENFTLNTSNADTRYAAEEGASGIRLNFTEGDQLGAAIIDNYDPDAESPYDFKVIYSLAGNNPFEFQGGDQWTSNTELGIGHYLFKFPYKQADNNRAAATFELPTVQKLYTDENGELDLTAAIEAGNMAVAATVLTEGQRNADVSLKNLFTYPKVQINFDNGEKVNTVSQVVLEYAEEITVKGGFNHRVVANLFDDAPQGLDDEDYWDKETQSIIWDEVETSDFLLAESGEGADYNPYPENERKSKYIVVKFPKNTQVKLDSNTKNKYVEARFMLPSVEDFKDDYSGKLTMYVYTDNGVYKAPFEHGSFIFKSTTTNETINGALGRGKGYNLTLNKAFLTKSNEQNIVTTVEDWNGLVEAYGSSKNSVPVAIVGDEFAFDSNTKFPSVSTFEVGTDVNVKGNVEIRNVDLGTNTINVLEGATLTVNNTLVAKKIVNEGTVNVIAKADEDTKESYNGVQTIENKAKATLNVAAGADAKFVLCNEKNAKVDEKDGAVIVAKGAKMTVAGYNYGTIDVNGIMWTVGDGFENKEIETKGEVVLNTPTINIYKDAQVVANFGTLTNNGLVVNEGEFTCQSNAGMIVNNKELQSKEGAVSYITENKGKVVVEVANPTTLTISNKDDKGIVEYTTGKSSEDFTGSDVNTVIATGNYEVRGGNLATLTLKGTGTLKVNAGAKIGKLDVDGNITLGENVKVGVDGLNIAEGAMINIPKGTVLTVNTAEYENLGRILVGGTLNAMEVYRSDRGDVNNDGGQITWKDDADKAEEIATAKANYDNALVAAIKEWASNSNSTSKVTVHVLDYDITNANAANLFANYAVGSGNSTKDEFVALTEALAKYQEYEPSTTLISGYVDAAAKVIADNKADVEALSLTWKVSGSSSRAYAHIYETEAEAITAFKAAVAKETVKVSNTLHKVVICSSNDASFIPEYSYVLTSDPVYEMFSYIEQEDDWKKTFEFTYTYRMEEVDDWSLNTVKQWIADVRKTTNGSRLVQESVDFVVENDLWNECQEWAYDVNIIKGIVTDYNK